MLPLSNEPTQRVHPARVTPSPWPANFSFGQLLDEFVPLNERTLYAVNIGARNCGPRDHDPVYPLFAERG